MAARPLWSDQLRLPLVSMAVLDPEEVDAVKLESKRKRSSRKRKRA